MTAPASHPDIVHAEPADRSSAAYDAHQNIPDPTAPEGESGAFALTSFMLGIASVLFGWTLIAPIIGLVLGSIALRRRTGERTLALWGVWLNGIILALAAIGVFLLILALSVGALALPFLV